MMSFTLPPLLANPVRFANFLMLVSRDSVNLSVSGFSQEEYRPLRSPLCTFQPCVSGHIREEEPAQSLAWSWLGTALSGTAFLCAAGQARQRAWLERGGELADIEEIEGRRCDRAFEMKLLCFIT